MSASYFVGRSVFGLFVVGLLVFASPARSAEQPSVGELVAATKSTDEEARVEAIRGLGKRRDPATIDALIVLLDDESPQVRGHAAWALGQIGPPAKSAAEGLAKLFGDSHQGVRRQAVQAMISIRPGPKVGVPLFVKLMKDSDPGVQMRVLQAVAEAGENAVPAMIEALDTDAAYWACVVLRDIGPAAKAAVPALTKALGDPRPEIRREAILALAAIGAPDALPKIVPLLNDEHSRVPATYAMAALGKIPAGAESTVRQNAKSDDPFVATVSLWALARVHSDDDELLRAAVTQLVARLKDEDPFVRTAAARALASLPPRPDIAGPIFEKALSDADETTTHYMLDAIAAQGPKSVPRLIKALEYEALRGQVAQVLGRIGPPAAPATSALAKLVDDPDPNVAIEAAHALGKIGPGAKAAVPELVDALKHPEGRTAYAAAYALGAIGPDAAAAAPTLLAVVENSDNSLSLVCAWSLVKVRGASAQTAAAVLPELITGLESSLPQSRETAADTLGELGTLAKKAVPQLQRAANDENERVRAAATAALKAING